jgi:iron complex outermembrane receptor protein
MTMGDAEFHAGAAYAQGSFEVSNALTLMAGVRHDRRSESESATNPRLAAIVTPDQRTTVKVMYGASYRPPSATEEGFPGTYYAPNPDLRPEHIATLELEIQRRVLAPLLLGASVYSYSVKDLIESVQIESGARLQHENLSGARATGLELQADWLPGGSHTAHASYALQVATSEPDQLRMTNSPSQIANLQIASRAESGVHSSLALRYESGRRTVSGSRTNSFLRTDVSAGYSMADRLVPGWLRPLDFSLRVTNLLNSSYSVPAGSHHVQSSIAQDGRAWSIRVDWRR